MIDIAFMDRRYVLVVSVAHFAMRLSDFGRVVDVLDVRMLYIGGKLIEDLVDPG